MSESSSIRILYMEDDVGLARLLQRRLERKGYLVDIAFDGELGLTMVDNGNYTLLLIDYNMPRYGGLDVIRHLNDKGVLIPAIMLTANGNEKIAVEAMKLGAADYLVKDTEMGYLELLPIIIDQVIKKQNLIKERQIMLQALQESEERYRRLVELSPDGIAVYYEGKFIFINPGGAKILGADHVNQLIGKPVLSVIHPAYFQFFIDKLMKIKRFNNLMPWTEEKFIRLDGKEIDVEIAGIPFNYQEKQGIQVIFRDITDRKRAEQRLEYLALYDSLTGLPNRFMFFDRMRQALAQAKRYNHPIGLLFLDLDRFKAINDTLGHDIGDLLLKETAKRLKLLIRESDSLARMGGDEFTVILTKMAEEHDAGIVAERIIKAISRPFHLKDHVCSIGISIGISLYPMDSDDVEILLKKADMAMYRVKEKSRNNYQFYQSLAFFNTL